MTGQQHLLCHRDDIPEDGSKGFRSDKFSVFAVKKGGGVYLYRNHCPHLGIGLEWVENQFLDVSKTLIQCANHSALFDITTGRCVVGPCSGQSLTPVPFYIENGNIFITLE